MLSSKETKLRIFFAINIGCEGRMLVINSEGLLGV